MFQDVLQQALESGAEGQKSAVRPAINTLAAVNPGKVVPEIIRKFVDTFNNEEVYVNDNDFGVFLTPGTF